MTRSFDIGMVDRTCRRYSKKDPLRSAGHHMEIADAIAAHAPDRARTAMQTHLRAVHGAAPVARDVRQGH